MSKFDDQVVVADDLIHSLNRIGDDPSNVEATVDIIKNSQRYIDVVCYMIEQASNYEGLK